MERQLVEWLVRYGAPMLFFAQVFGIFGLPIPDELLLTLAGALVRKGPFPPDTLRLKIRLPQRVWIYDRWPTDGLSLSSPGNQELPAHLKRLARSLRNLRAMCAYRTWAMT
jgi:hypothetical protein